MVDNDDRLSNQQVLRDFFEFSDKIIHLERTNF
jgi:hypothetical protein